LKHYVHLAVMTALMFIAMYVLMYAMVDRLENVFPNVNQFYMAGLMTAPMVLIEIVIMRVMYESRSANAAISDEQFLKSMIPHHAGAILMCQKAPIEDGEIRSLCQSILRSQQSEIEQMKAIMARVK
jgi:uncharacterized protein (DUF305 family)